MPKLSISAAGEALPSRRRFLSLFAPAAAGVAIAAPTPVKSSTAQDVFPKGVSGDDPIFELAQGCIDAKAGHEAALKASDAAEGAMIEWRTKNPRPERRRCDSHPNAALSLKRDEAGGWYDLETSERLTNEQVSPDDHKAEQKHKRALRNWRQRERYAERRTGYAAAERTIRTACIKHSNAIQALQGATPVTLVGLVAKARACRANKDDDELAASLMWDIGVLAGEVDENGESR
jgi:hypothetical protein